MKIKVMSIFGSPRRGGNTDTLMEEMLSGISRDGGVEINRIFLGEMKIKHCTGCGYCETTGVCNIMDDMQEIYPLLEESRIIIISSPVYFYGVTSQTKAMIDRTHVFWARKYILNRPWSIDDEMIRQGVLITAAGTKLPHLFVGPELIVRYFFNCMDIVYQGKIAVPGVQEYGSVKEMPDELKKSYNMGVQLMNPY